jgi:hypothetical protein
MEKIQESSTLLSQSFVLVILEVGCKLATIILKVIRISFPELFTTIQIHIITIKAANLNRR